MQEYYCASNYRKPPGGTGRTPEKNKALERAVKDTAPVKQVWRVNVSVPVIVMIQKIYDHDFYIAELSGIWNVDACR